MQSLANANRGNELSDEALLHAIAGGDIRAMEPLYARYHRLLYALAYRIVSDPLMAEDLLQEAFLAVWRHSHTYSPHAGAARSWLISILHHRDIDHLRKLRRRSDNVQETPLEQLELDERTASADTWETAWRLVQRSQVRAALLKIPREQRQVIELSYFQGWTHTEIAEQIQIPLGTVKARLRLGLHHLEHTLRQMGLDEM